MTEKLRDRKHESLRKMVMTSNSPIRSPRRPLNKPVMDKEFVKKYESPYAQKFTKPTNDDYRNSIGSENRSPIRPFS